MTKPGKIRDFLPNPMDFIFVFTNLPDRDSALLIAQELITGRYAACVNVLGGCTSVYRWKGEIEKAEEVPLLIKTRGSLYAEVERVIRERHPYDLPEIIAVPVTDGLPAYLDWLKAETLPSLS
ncbi:MAG: divalent-cation tolerance protein CutA [Burkholderiales bacterium]